MSSDEINRVCKSCGVTVEEVTDAMRALQNASGISTMEAQRLAEALRKITDEQKRSEIRVHARSGSWRD